ncbi:UDP-3-O-(3-hydroxymyristoyl)glucosamine N-acyltransferase [Gallaecimonas sp. GXIMD4217]|uniref:UDP-3-O-(3-hydroxymyristoyl)glucosamine N-acyltransferase n=1 Tax=Gallaecimonas sp. GXIMD4217 TaxID=3131927 RepID=UPI00311AD38B
MAVISLAELAKTLDAKLVGDGDIPISRVNTLESAGPGQLAFLANSKYRKQLQSTKAEAVILTEKDLEYRQGAALVMANPYLGFARVAQLLDSTPPAAVGIHPTAVIDPSVQLGKDVAIGAHAVLEAGVVIGDHCQVGANCFIGRDSVLGAGTKLWANVSLYHDVQLGERCLVQSGVVIGSDGFGYANDKGTWVHIPQTGGVRIGNDVEVGAGTTIDRGALEHTVIGDGTILDNQVQVAHNVRLGKGCAVAGNTVFAGSCSLGDHCIVGGSAGVAGHLEVTSGVTITGMTMVTKAITEPGVYSSGTAAQPNREWRKSAARFRQLDEMYKRLKALEAELAALKAPND